MDDPSGECPRCAMARPPGMTFCGRCGTRFMAPGGLSHGRSRAVGMPSPPEPTLPVEPRPLIRIIAELITFKLAAEQIQVRYAIDHGEPVYEPCSCRVAIGIELCACSVEHAASERWMDGAARRLARGATVGWPAARRCRLCRAGDHDLVATTVIRIVLPDGTESSRPRVAAWRRTDTRRDARRAARAGAWPPGTHAAQSAAARSS